MIMKFLISEGDVTRCGPKLGQSLKTKFLSNTFWTPTEYSLKTFLAKVSGSVLDGGFVRYAKYRRLDVLRLLNWPIQPVMINVGGYQVSKDKTNCPIFCHL